MNQKEIQKESEEEKKWQRKKEGPWTEIGSKHLTGHDVALTLFHRKPPEG